jgi:DNA repair exonuclease SbcCD ATPase subunit
MDSQDMVQEKHLYASKEEVLERIKELAHGEEEVSKAELDHLKTAYYKLLNAEKEATEKAYLEAGGDPMQFVATQDETEEVFKAEMNLIKERRSQLLAQREEEKQKNLKRKQEIIERIKAVATTPDAAGAAYQEVKELQAEWKELKNVPAENAAELWNNYKLVLEQFYDLLKMNFEAREYDFKKNLELKTALCEAAEKLGTEEDVISAFHQLQELHNQFREIGPVAKDLRESIWNRFKQASTVVNKRHADHFDAIRAKEEENLSMKSALCEKVEAIQTAALTTAAEWEAKGKEIIGLQKEWKTIGFAPKAMNVKIFERFRTACDQFFTAKNEFFQELKSRFEENIAKKQDLIKKAQELQDSTDWKATAEKLQTLQKEWKSIGAVPRKMSDQLWNDFLAACNKFFEARNTATAGERNEQQDNLKKKQDIIEKLKTLLAEEAEDLQKKVQQLTEEYNAIGHVPFKDKDKLYKEYHDTLDDIFKKINKSRANRNLDNFRNNLKEVAKRGEGAINSERQKLQRRYESMKQELQTYENNLNFLSSSSKKGNSLIDEMNKKMEKLRDDLALIQEKIKAMKD